MGRRGWMDLLSAHLVVRVLVRPVGGETTGQMDDAAFCLSSSLLPLELPGVWARLVIADPSLLGYGHMETAGCNWTFTSLRFGHKAAATSHK